MKHRIFSVALVLCLCISSPSAAYANQGTPSPSEDVLPEETPKEVPDEPVAGDDESAIPSEEPSLPDVLPEKSPDIPDDEVAGDDEGTPLPEAPSPSVDVLPEETPKETPDEPAVSDGGDTEETGNTGNTAIVPKEVLSPQEEVPLERTKERQVTRDGEIPTPTKVYEDMIALKDQEKYKEGAIWTNDTPYPDSNGDDYHWNGGLIGGVNISAVGCVAFAFSLSDAAFGSLPARMYAKGEFSFEDIKVGDILRVSNDAHTVIVLEVSDAGVVVAEGNISTGDHKGKVHWGRAISRNEVMNNTSHYITRYPEGYVAPDDPTANDTIASDSLDGGLTWTLTKAGTLTISGNGAMPDFSSTGDQPWNNYSSQIRKVVIEDGVTSIGACAFWNCGVLSAEISSSVTKIGNSAFRGSSIISVTIPSGVKTIGDSAFRECQNLSSATVSEGVETIEQNAFRACTSLTSIALPASIGEVGSAAFWECTAMTNATFASGTSQVKMGDNMFTRCYELTNVTLPSNIDRISEGMFQNCLMLAEVEIPQGAESIGGSAFASCSRLAAVIIPDSVTTIGSAAFSACVLTDIYFTGSEAQWNSISKIGDTASAVSKATVHYNYVPAPSPSPSPSPSPNPGDGDDDSTGNNPGGDNSGGDNPGGDNPGGDGGDNSGDNSGSTSGGNRPGSSSDSSTGNNAGSDNDSSESESVASFAVHSGIQAVVETWKPTTPDEIKRYACLGRDAVRYTQPGDNAYPIDIKNAMQGPLCFQSFEAVLGDYTIGRTYNVYAISNTTYSTDKEVQFSIKIPSDIYRADREYKMICVTKGGKPIVYNDLDSDPETVTVKTDKFHAYALIYRQKQS